MEHENISKTNVFYPAGTLIRFEEGKSFYITLNPETFMFVNNKLKATSVLKVYSLNYKTIFNLAGSENFVTYYSFDMPSETMPYLKLVLPFHNQ